MAIIRHGVNFTREWVGLFAEAMLIRPLPGSDAYIHHAVTLLGPHQPVADAISREIRGIRVFEKVCTNSGAET